MPGKPSYDELEKRVQDLEQAAANHEKSLRKSDKPYRRLFQNSHAMMLLIDPESADILDANPAAVSFYGWPKQDLLARKLTDINTLSRDEILMIMKHAKTRRKNQFIFKHCLASGEIRDVEVFSGPIERQGRNLLFSIIHDITERKQAEAKLEAMAREWQTTFDSTSDAVFLLDPDMRIQRINKKGRQAFGHPRENLVGKKCWEVVHGTKAPVSDCPNLKSMNSLCRESAELKIKDKWFQVVVDPIPDQDGRSMGGVHMMRDITEQKKAEQALVKERNQLKNALEQIKTLRGLVPICSHCKKSGMTRGSGTTWNLILKGIPRPLSATACALSVLTGFTVMRTGIWI